LLEGTTTIGSNALIFIHFLGFQHLLSSQGSTLPMPTALDVRYVGYSQDSMTAAEFDITNVLKQSKKPADGGLEGPQGQLVVLGFGWCISTIVAQGNVPLDFGKQNCLILGINLTTRPLSLQHRESQ